MQSPMKIMLSAGLGAAAMYYLDPVQGRERRDIARERLEQGRGGLQHAGLAAKSVGHDVGKGTGRAIRGMRAAGHEVGGRAERAWHLARSAGQDVGDRAGRFTHGLREAGHGARERAVGAAASLGSLLDGHRPRLRRPKLGRHSRHHSHGHPALKFVGIPVKWLLFAGIGAAAMYFMDPSQGLYRRVRFRERFLRARDEHLDGDGMPESEDAERSEVGRQPGRGPSLRDEERPLPG